MCRTWKHVLCQSVEDQCSLQKSNSHAEYQSVGITRGETFNHSNLVIAATSDVQCHSLILSFSDVLDVMSKWIDQKKSVREYVAVQVVLVLALFLESFHLPRQYLDEIK